MSISLRIIRKLTSVAIFTCVLALPATADYRGHFDNGALRGAFVLSIDGAFVSAPPPFTGSALSFKAAQLGRLVFDGTGLAWGEATLTFHNPDIPFGVTSRVSVNGTYDVAPNGKAVINLDEFALDMNGEPGMSRTNSIILECYVIRRRLKYSCVLHTLISYQKVCKHIR